MKTEKIALLSATFALACTLPAQTTLFTFGDNAYSGTNAPGHASEAIITGTNWNTLATDTASGIVDQDGNATTISIDFGRETADGTNTLDYSAATRAASYTLNSGFNGTIFDSNLGTNNAVRDSGGTVGIGFSLTGLQPGQYTYYITAFRGDGSTTDAGNSGEFTIFSGVSGSAITDFTGLSQGTITNANQSTWEAGNNHITGTVTISSATDHLSFFSDGFRTDTDSDFIGVINSLELAAIPEPGTSALLLGIAGLALISRRRCA